MQRDLQQESEMKHLQDNETMWFPDRSDIKDIQSDLQLTNITFCQSSWKCFSIRGRVGNSRGKH